MSDGRHTAGITTRLIVAYVRRHLGDDHVGLLLQLAGETRGVEVVEDETTWSSYPQKIALLEAAAQLTEDRWAAYRIGTSVLGEQLGGLTRAVLGALGSPQLLLRSIARANIKFSTSATMRAIESRPTGGVVAYRLHDEHTPDLHDCRYNQGLLSQVSSLFGLPAADVSHPSCQVEGAPECIYEVQWSRRRRGLRRGGRDRPHPVPTGLEHGLTEFGRSVADLISTESLEELLPRIATRAASAMHAHRHLLAVRVDGQVHVHADGLDPAQAQRLGRQLLRTGELELPGTQQLLVPVASARAHHGWLLAFQPAHGGFLPDEQQHLATYAGLAAASLDVSVALVEARRSSEIGTALVQLSRQLAVEHDLVAVARRGAEAATKVAGSDRASLLLWDEDERAMRTVAAVGFDGLEQLALRFAVPREVVPELWDRMREDDRPLLLDRDDADPFIQRAMASYGHDAVVITPVRAEDELIGVLLASWLERNGDGGVEAAHLDTLVGIADQVGLAILRVRLLEEVRHAASHDELTGLANRRLFRDRVNLALADNRRSGLGCAVAFIDLDDFKQVNDTHGHAAGDQVLVEVAARIRAAVRETDSVARLAGDEFAVLLRDLEDDTAAERVADALRTALCAPYVLDGTVCRLSASIGVARAPDHGDSAEALVRAADAAMYAVKRTGDGFLVAAWDHAPHAERPVL